MRSFGRAAGGARPPRDNAAAAPPPIPPPPPSTCPPRVHTPPPRANSLNCEYQTWGGGVYSAADGPWWTQDFGY